MTQDKAQAAGAVSIEFNEEFRTLISHLNAAIYPPQIELAQQAIFKFCDAHAAQRYEAGYQAGLAHAVQTIKNSNDTASIALKQRDAAESGFKNFHRSLCARFGYSHDERDWKRDQVSLEEYIASEMVIERDRATAAEASLARLVEGVEGLDRYFSEVEGERRIVHLRTDLLTLLPAKAESSNGMPSQDMESRMQRLGKHVMEFATEGGWQDDGEGAFEFIQRQSYAVGISDAGKTPPSGPRWGNRWPIDQLEPATPAPAMGEELPPLPEPYGGHHIPVFTADQMQAYGRACMALRQPGAEKVDFNHGYEQANKDYCKMLDENEHYRERVFNDIMKADAAANLNRFARTAAPAAPVSQPAAQEAVAWIVFAEHEGKMIPQYPAVLSEVEADRHASMYGQTKTEVRPLFDTAPLSAPAGSGQALTDEQIESLWQSLPGIEIHNKAAKAGVDTNYALRLAHARAVLAKQQEQTK